MTSATKYSKLLISRKKKIDTILELPYVKLLKLVKSCEDLLKKATSMVLAHLIT